MSTRIPPRGIYVPVPTFFIPPSSPNYNPITPPLDLPIQSAHAIHLAKCGIRGILLLGSSGEAIMVSNAERKELITHVRQELDRGGFKSYPIMAGTATQGIEDTLEQLLISHEAGADWGMVLAPGYFAPVVTQEGLVDWYTAIADRSPMPIMMYAEPLVPIVRLMAPLRQESTDTTTPPSPTTSPSPQTHSSHSLDTRTSSAPNSPTPISHTTH